MSASLYHSPTNKFEICYCVNRTICETVWNREEAGVFFSPTPEIVANISIEELREQKFSQRKAEYIVGLGRSIVSGNIKFSEYIENGTEEDISAQLLPIRGIGAWTVKTF